MKFRWSVGSRLWITIAVTALCTAHSASASRLKDAQTQVLPTLLQAQLAVRDADDKMYKSMQTAADHLQKYRSLHHRFPEPGSELDRFIAGMDARAPNPYKANQLLAQDLPESCPRQIEYRVSTELGLSTQFVLAASKQPPKSWQAAPGTITIIHNTENMIVVWAAGVNGLPIIDSTTGNARIVQKTLAN